MATTVQLIAPNGADRGEPLKLYVGRSSLFTVTYPVQFDAAGRATVSGEDLSALMQLGVVRVLS